MPTNVVSFPLFLLAWDTFPFFLMTPPPPRTVFSKFRPILFNSPHPLIFFSPLPRFCLFDTFSVFILPRPLASHLPPLLWSFALVISIGPAHLPTTAPHRCSVLNSTSVLAYSPTPPEMCLPISGFSEEGKVISAISIHLLEVIFS